jgi:hypothetical protein
MTWPASLARALLLVALMFLSPASLAEDQPAEAQSAATAEPKEESLWEMRLAAFTRYGSSYPASEETQFNFIPLPFPIYRGRYLRLGGDAEKPIQGRLFRRDRIRLGIDFDLRFGSDSDEIAARTGMPDLDFMLEAGPELELQFVDGNLAGGDLFLALQLRAAFSFDGLDPTYRGVVFNPELQYLKKLRKPRQQLRVRLTPAFGSSDYMAYYYTVDPQFATLQRSAFDAKSGYMGTDLSVAIRQPITKKFEIWSGLRFGFHQGAKNDDSPLYTQDITPSIYVVFLYKFWESKKQVPVED